MRISLFVLAVVPTALHAAPIELAHQARLLDSTGTPIHGAVTITARLYAAQGDPVGAALWSHTYPTSAEDGFVSLTLGDDGSLQDTVLLRDEVWIGLEVAGAEVTRQRLLRVPRAVGADRTFGVVTEASPTGPCAPGELRYDSDADALAVCNNAGAWASVGVATSRTSIVSTGGIRAWSDGSFAADCNGYRHPLNPDAFMYAGDTGDGLYQIDPDGDGTPQTVYCDMTTDGGGWTLVASNHSSDTTFPGGVGRTNLFLYATGYSGNPSTTTDYLIGPAIDAITYTETRLFADENDDGVNVVHVKLAQSCHRCRQTNNFGTLVNLAGHNVANLGCGLAKHCNVDGQYADLHNGSFDSNANQRTVGFVCTNASPDPKDGTYVGHGSTEGSFEGAYYGTGSCGAHDMDTYTTWVR